MRNEEEMFAQILSVARADERVRAVYLNGSRANPNVAKDMFRDYDVVYVVTTTEPYVKNPDWITAFGEVAIVQEPDRNDAVNGMKMDFSRSFTWLALFRDGNRVDLHVETVEVMRESYGKDTLTVPLLDKDGVLPALPPASEEGYYIRKPREEVFHASSNEFWWCLNNVAKGIVRRQLPYVMWVYYGVVHGELERMTEWYIAMRQGGKVTTGAHGKYFQKYLPEDLYRSYERTYADGDYEHIWEAVFTACALFGKLARAIADGYQFSYRVEEEKAVLVYLRQMRAAAAHLQ